MISVILVEPETPGNIGAVARVMANFGFKELLLINPKCNYMSSEAIARSKHAKNILEKAKVIDFSFLKKFHTIVGTTSKLGSDYNLPRTPLTPEEIAKKITKIKNNVCILFGREGIGLTNKEIKRCDFITTIPTSKYSALNLSHSVAVILYELSKHKTKHFFKLAAKSEKDRLLKLINTKLENIKFTTPEKRETQKTLWKRIIGKAMLTKREIMGLFGFFKKIK